MSTGESEFMELSNTVKSWLFDENNIDQDVESKIEFVQKSMVGPITRLRALGISNGKLKKYANQVSKEYKNIELDELLEELDIIYQNSISTEEKIIVYYILEKYKKLVVNNSQLVFNFIDENWIDDIDHWTSSDHLCIDALKHIKFDDTLREKIDSWIKSDNFWRRRLAVTTMLKHTKVENNAKYILTNIDLLKEDTNYYVRKTFPWLIRTISDSFPAMIKDYLLINYKFFSKTELRDATKKLDSITIEKILQNYNQFIKKS